MSESKRIEPNNSDLIFNDVDSPPKREQGAGELFNKKVKLLTDAILWDHYGRIGTNCECSICLLAKEIVHSTPTQSE